MAPKSKPTSSSGAHLLQNLKTGSILVSNRASSLKLSKNYSVSVIFTYLLPMEFSLFSNM